jgi:hypothetical protein
MELFHCNMCDPVLGTLSAFTRIWNNERTGGKNPAEGKSVLFAAVNADL